MSTPQGVILWSGRSLFNGAPIVVVVTNLVRRSANEATGDMLQSYIIRSRISAMDAVRSGRDDAICWNCPHRGNGFKRSCHVNPMHGPEGTYGALRRGLYPRFDPKRHLPLFSGRLFRAGFYGDPAMTPFAPWEPIFNEVAGWTGYTHQWRTCDQQWRRYLMASCDSPADRRAALMLGWRTFRVRDPLEPLLDGEFACPKSKEAGERLDCSQCLACDGAHISTRAASPSIILHGDGLPHASPKLNAFRSFRLSLPKVNGGTR